jgi:hypothetical protein
MAWARARFELPVTSFISAILFQGAYERKRPSSFACTFKALPLDLQRSTSHYLRMGSMSSFEMDEGSGHFVFVDQVADLRRSMRVFYFRPKASFDVRASSLPCMDLIGRRWSLGMFSQSRQSSTA